MKTCFKCGENKPLNEFYKHSQMADGRLNKCKGCTKKDVSSHRHGAGREKVLAYDRARALTPERIAHRSRHVSDWRASFPERAAAQASLAYAVKTGRHGRELDTEPLHRFASKLEHAMPFDEADVRDVKALIPVLRRIASTMDQNDAADLTRQTQIKAELENRSVE